MHMDSTRCEDDWVMNLNITSDILYIRCFCNSLIEICDIKQNTKDSF